MKERTETQIAIEEQFMKLYKRKEYSKITVKELCAETPVARTTFYAYYQNIEEVKDGIEDYLIEELKRIAKSCSQGQMESMDFETFFDETIMHLQSRWDKFYTFMILQPNLSFQNKWKKAIKLHFEMRYPTKKNISNYELIAEVMASAVLGAYRFWFQNPEKVDAKKLNKIVCASLDAVTAII